MEVKKKTFTLKVVFFKYLLTLVVAFIVFVGLYFAVFVLMQMKSVIIQPNYSEILARGAKPLLASAPEITENMIPDGCKFAVLNKKYKVTKTNLDGKDLLTAIEYAKGTYSNDGRKKCYYFIERQDGSCVLQYYLQMRYQSEFLNKHLPGPQKTMAVIFAVIYFFSVFITTVIWSKKLNKHLKPLLQATEKIKKQDLDFDIKYSGIKEFNDVILSISDMKTELKKSLEEQWNIERAKKEQISALAHDLKTPLTIIKGNAELLSDSTISKEQQEYVNYISKNSIQIEKYIKILIEISNSEKPLFLQLEEIDSINFINTIKEQLEAIANTKGLKVKFIKTLIPKSIIIDKSLLYRAIMNVISNAVNYCPNNGEIYFEVKSVDNKIRFITTDSGNGFSGEDIKSATKQFYIANSHITGGAQVTIEIPIC